MFFSTTALVAPFWLLCQISQLITCNTYPEAGLGSGSFCTSCSVLVAGTEEGLPLLCLVKNQSLAEVSSTSLIPWPWCYTMIKANPMILSHSDYPWPLSNILYKSPFSWKHSCRWSPGCHTALVSCFVAALLKSRSLFFQTFLELRLPTSPHSHPRTSHPVRLPWIHLLCHWLLQVSPSLASPQSSRKIHTADIPFKPDIWSSSAQSYYVSTNSTQIELF